MRTIQDYYDEARLRPSDINQHVPYLHRLASTVNHVTELGTRTGVSTAAFLLARPPVFITMDIEQTPEATAMTNDAKLQGVNVSYVLADDLAVDIEQTDLLFIDTLHVREQMWGELNRHGGKVNKYIVMHDTETFAYNGELPGTEGIWPSVSRWLRENPNWVILNHFQHNNGLTTLLNTDREKLEQYSNYLANELNNCVSYIEYVRENLDSDRSLTFTDRNGNAHKPINMKQWKKDNNL